MPLTAEINYKNRYIKNARISERKFRELLRYFSLDMEANKAAVLSNINRNTVNRYYHIIRERIAAECRDSLIFNGLLDMVDEVGVDYSAESDLTQQVYGLISYKSRIFAVQSTPDKLTRFRSLHPVRSDSSASPNCAPILEGCIDLENNIFFKLLEGNIGSCGSASRRTASDAFWRFLKSRLLKFNGISKATISLHVKESEFRYNHRALDLYKVLLKLFKNDLLS